MTPKLSSQETLEEQQAEQLLSQTQAAAAAAAQLDSLQVISLFFSLTSRRIYLLSPMFTACIWIQLVHALYTPCCVRHCVLQVEQLTGQLEKLLEGPSVFPSVGQRAVAVVSELMEGDAVALSTSASRWRQCHPRNTHPHTTFA